MRHSFYDSDSYKKKQSKKTKLAWVRGVHLKNVFALEDRKCRRKGCGKTFKVKPYNPKLFCSQHCSATHNNLLRGPMKEEVRKKVSQRMKGRLIGGALINKGKFLVPRVECQCLKCGKTFITLTSTIHKYCSVYCSIHDIGSRPTSPRAARAKSGIRNDIDPNTYFFSRWEANFARILNLLKIKWVFQPKTFDLRFQKYTPDFYLPEHNLYVEIKNYMSDYSARRDKAFRKLYPTHKLSLILRPNYTKLESTFAKHIKEWEFSR